MQTRGGRDAARYTRPAATLALPRCLPGGWLAGTAGAALAAVLSDCIRVACAVVVRYMSTWHADAYY